MAAEDKAPRFLRFLRNITGPEANPIKRTQFFVIQAIAENVDAQLLFNGDEGIHERGTLIAANDLELNPRGRLAYHVELIGLISRCTEGLVPGPEAIGRSLISIGELLRHLVSPNLPLALRSNYLAFLDEAYLYAKRPLEKSTELTALVNVFARSVETYVEETVPHLDADFQSNADDVALCDYVLQRLMKTMRLLCVSCNALETCCVAVINIACSH